MAHIATGNPDEALDIVQDAMLTLVKSYAQRDSEEWGPLFTRIVQNRIRDWYRREKVRSKWRVWFGKDEDDQQGLDVNETAKALGISSGSVKTHYSRAVHRLREVLGHHRHE